MSFHSILALLSASLGLPLTNAVDFLHAGQGRPCLFKCSLTMKTFEHTPTGKGCVIAIPMVRCWVWSARFTVIALAN